jgi:hypothetical protein
MVNNQHPTLSLPFGRDVDTLILCKNDDQRRRAIKALGIPARYELIYSVLTGYRFKKIIVLGCRPESETETLNFNRLLKEDLPTKLEVGCSKELFVL